MNDAGLVRLVDPVHRAGLTLADGALIATDGTRYPVSDGIADLIASRPLEGRAAHEADVFDSLPIEGVCYFRPDLFTRVLDKILPLLGCTRTGVEIGGGEGWFARAFMAGTGAAAYVCDVSRRALANADPTLFRIHCDVRRPYLADGTIGLAAFWVSLHHFSDEDRAAALDEGCRMLAKDGLMLVFEPNRLFLPRRLFMASPLAKLVYFDDHEEALDCRVVTGELARRGFELVCSEGVNPPYGIAFLRYFKAWPLFWAATEALRLLDRLWPGRLPMGWGSYVLAIYRQSGKIS